MESFVTTVVQRSRVFELMSQMLVSHPDSLYKEQITLCFCDSQLLSNPSLIPVSSFLSLMSSHLPPRCRLSGGAACGEKQQSEIFQSRHCCAAQWPHSGSLQLDPVLSGPHAVFRWSTLTAINPEKSPVQQNLQDICPLLSAKLSRSHGLPRGLWAPALRLPGFGLPNVQSHYQEPVCVTSAGSQQPAKRPPTCAHSGKLKKLRVEEFILLFFASFIANTVCHCSTASSFTQVKVWFNYWGNEPGFNLIIIYSDLSIYMKIYQLIGFQGWSGVTDNSNVMELWNCLKKWSRVELWCQFCLKCWL